MRISVVVWLLQLQQTTNFVTSFPVFEKKNKLWSFIRIVCRQTIPIEYHALLYIISEKAAKFEIVVCCKL